MRDAGNSSPVLFTLWAHCPLMSVYRNSSLEQDVNPALPWSILWFHQWFKVYGSKGSLSENHCSKKELYFKFPFFSTTNCLDLEGFLPTPELSSHTKEHSEKMSFSRDVGISFLTPILEWTLNEIQTEHIICLVMIAVLLFMNFINVEVSFISSGLWLLSMLLHVCWECFIPVILPIHWSVLSYPAFRRCLILCITYALQCLCLFPQSPPVFWLPHGQNVVAIFREKQAYFGRKSILF